MVELKKERYKGRFIEFRKFGKEVRATIPFGGSEFGKTKEEAFNNIKNRIDQTDVRRKAEEDSFKQLKFPKKQIFHYTIIKSRNTGFGGTNVTAKVLKQDKDGLDVIGEVKWNTASFKGEESAVLDFLKDKSAVPKGMFPSGYYIWNEAEQYNMKILKI